MSETGKHIPSRRCMGCNEPKAKNDLIRIVRKPDGEITADETGRVSGRGAYVCAEKACIEKIRKSKRAARSLESEIPAAVYEALEAIAAKRTGGGTS